MFRAVSKGCTNAAWPDLHGHYREARYTQTKHHWWWKANQVTAALSTVSTDLPTNCRCSTI